MLATTSTASRPSRTDTARLSIVDNTFVTPYLQQPLDLGADIVIHSATKYLAGHSEVNAGLVVVLDDEVGNGIYFAQNRFGGVLAPTECNDVRRGIQTLALRMECQQRNAQAVAEYLLAHPLVRAVHYPGVYGDRNRLLAENGLKGFGGVLSFEVVPGSTRPSCSTTCTCSISPSVWARWKASPSCHAA